MRDTLGPTVLLMGGRVLAFLGSFLLPLVLVRIFEPAEFGTYKQLVLTYTTLYLVAQLGMAESLFFFLPRRPEQSGGYVANATLALAAIGLVSATLLGLSGPILTRAFGNAAIAEAILPAAAYLGLTLGAAHLEIVMIARNRYRGAAAAYGVTDLARAAAFLAGALALGGVGGIFLAGAVFGALRLAFALRFFSREFPASLRPAPSPFRAQAAYALPFAAAIVLEIAQKTFHQYAVSYAFDPAMFAVYAVGCLQVPLVDFVAGPAGNVTMVRMGEELRAGRAASVLRLWHDLTRRLALVFFPLAGVTIVVAADLVPLLFTERYRASVPILELWGITIALGAFMTDAVLRVHADTRWMLRLSLLRLAVNVALIGLFVERLGLRGAAAVTVLAIAVAKAAAVLRAGRLMGVGFAEALPWGALVGAGGATVAASSLALVARASLDASAALRLVAVAAVFAAVYLGLVALLGLVYREERELAGQWLRRAANDLQKLERALGA